MYEYHYSRDSMRDELETLCRFSIGVECDIAAQTRELFSLSGDGYTQQHVRLHGACCLGDKLLIGVKQTTTKDIDTVHVWS